MPRRFPSPEFTRLPTEKELETSGRREKIDRRYDHLLAERKKLYEALDNFKLRDFDIIFTDLEVVDDETFEKITNTWLERVRSETELLEIVDNLGIEIFKEDLEDQPGFPDEKIVFHSKKIKEEQLVNLRHVGGFAKRQEHKIEIKEPKPTLRGQIFNFLEKGKIDSSTATLIHELIHRYHLREEPYTNGILTEAQAYFSGILEVGSDFSLTGIAQTLIQPESEKGLYEYDADEVIKTITAVAGLYALGKTSNEIAQLIIDSDYYDSRAENLTEVLKELQKKYKLDEIDLQALDDIRRLHATNQRLKAQLALYQTINEQFSIEELRAAKTKRLSRDIGCPNYCIKGKPVPARELLQKVVTFSDNDEFPYDFDSKRTGIIFGFFPKGEGGFDFSLGRWEAEGRDSVLDLAKTPEEIDRYLEILDHQAKNIGLESKKTCFIEYFQIDAYSNPLFRRVIKSLISQEEAKKIIDDFVPHISESLNFIIQEIEIMEEKIANGDELKKKDIEKIGTYLKMISGWNAAVKLFELDFSDIDKDLAGKFEKLKPKIEILTPHIEKYVREFKKKQNPT